jgi:putative DNA primase/helicase
MTMNGTADAEIAAWSADVFAERDGPVARPVLGPLLRRGCVTLLTGPRGVGKSWLALAMAQAVARGGSLAGWRTHKDQRAVFLDAAGSEALLRARLAALAGGSPPPALVIAPGDAQVHGLPDLADESGRTALDRLVADAGLVVIDGLVALVQAGRGVGLRWSALSGWLRVLRRRGVAVLLVETSEPRAIAALADTVLRLERPADATAEPGLRMTVRLAAVRAPADDTDRVFGLHMALRDGGAVWTRHDAIDHRALVAWRLHQRKYSTREIARKLGVSPATAWRLVERGEALPAHLRVREELPELEDERREQVAEERLAARREARRAAREAAWEAEEERERAAYIAARRDPHPPPSPAGGRRSPSRTPLPNGEREGPSAKRWEGEGENTPDDIDCAERAIARPLTPRADARDPLPVGARVESANSPEAVKHPPATIDDVATDDLVPVLLARRRWWKLEQAPPPDWLAPFDYQTLFHAARSRITSRRLNKLMLADDKRPFHFRT